MERRWRDEQNQGNVIWPLTFIEVIVTLHDWVKQIWTLENWNIKTVFKSQLFEYYFKIHKWNTNKIDRANEMVRLKKSTLMPEIEPTNKTAQNCLKSLMHTQTGLSISLFLSHSHTHSVTHSHTFTHTQSHTHTHFCSISQRVLAHSKPIRHQDNRHQRKFLIRRVSVLEERVETL